MKTVYKCEKCGMIFDEYSDCSKHETQHYDVKTWLDDEDEKVVSRETEYDPCLFVPTAVVLPMVRSIFDEESKEWKRETIYIKYYYTAKKPAEQVFPIDESVIK